MDLNNLDSLNISFYDKNEIKEGESEKVITLIDPKNKQIELDRNLHSTSVNPKEAPKLAKLMNFKTQITTGKKNTIDSKIFSSVKISEEKNKQKDFNKEKDACSYSSIHNKKSGERKKHYDYKNNIDYDDFNYKTNKNEGRHSRFSEDNYNNTNQVHENSEPTKPSLKEKLTLSDIEMYYKFGIYPYILLIHLLIIVFTTFIVSKK